MHGSTSPSKKRLPLHPSGPHPCHVTRSRTRPIARRAWPLAGSRPISRRSDQTCIVESHPRFHAPPPHRPSGAWRASSRAPAPSVATLARSAATWSAGASVTSRSTCQRIEGSESSSHPTTAVVDFKACRFGRFVAICYLAIALAGDAVGGLMLSTGGFSRGRFEIEFAFALLIEHAIASGPTAAHVHPAARHDHDGPRAKIFG